MGRNNLSYHWRLKAAEKMGWKRSKAIIVFLIPCIFFPLGQFNFTVAKLNTDNLLNLWRHSLKALEAEKGKVYGSSL